MAKAGKSVSTMKRNWIVSLGLFAWLTLLFITIVSWPMDFSAQWPWTGGPFSLPEEFQMSPETRALKSIVPHFGLLLFLPVSIYYLVKSQRRNAPVAYMTLGLAIAALADSYFVYGGEFNVTPTRLHIIFAWWLIIVMGAYLLRSLRRK